MKKLILPGLAVLFTATHTIGQIENTKEKATVKTETRINQRTDEAIDSGLDRIEDGIRGAFKKKDKKQRKAKASSSKHEENPSEINQSSQPVLSNPSSSHGADNTSPNNSGSQTDYSSFKKFDFVPGEHTLFYDDYTRGLEQWHVVSWDEWEEKHKGFVTTSNVAPGNWYYMPRKGMTAPKTLGALPNQFTIEFDFYYDDEHTEHEGGINIMLVKEQGFNVNNHDYYFDRNTRFVLDIHPSYENLFLKALREYGYTGGRSNGAVILDEQKENYLRPNQVYRVSLTRNGSHIQLYINQEKVLDLPTALPSKESYTFMFGNNSWISGLYVSNTRISSGAPNPAHEFGVSKNFTTQNIRFDVNSDKIKPESYSVLKEIAMALKSNQRNYLIVGHTDSDGNAQNNLILSEKRAAAVKRALIQEFAIDESRLTTQGKGDIELLNGNKNASEKAQNRRVEFRLLEE